MTAYYFVQPLDVLMMRGNRSFGGGGEHGEAVMPPWPSMFAGAFRAALLGQDAAVLAQFIQGITPNGELGKCLGTPAEPGSFRLSWLSLAQKTSGSGTLVTASIPLPADLAAFQEGKTENYKLSALVPGALPESVQTSNLLPLTALLRHNKQEKPAGGRCLHGADLQRHFAGEQAQHSHATSELYKTETRLGIALDKGSRTAAEGAIYTTEAIAFNANDQSVAGFLLGIDGADNLLAEAGILRMGGDGKGVRYQRVAFTPPTVSTNLITRDKRFRLLLATPGMFQHGWLPDGVTQRAGDYRLDVNGCSARLACAALPRFEVVSGWDLARWKPKTAQRVVPAGAVYWFDQFEGDTSKLAAWVAGGLWLDNCDKQRRAEGFNCAWLAAWPTHN